MSNCISINNLHASCGTHKVLNGLSASIPQGQLTAILGENGCGKSTLLKALCRLIPTSNGSVSVCNSQLPSLSQRTLAQTVSLVSQFTEPLPLSVFNYTLMGRTPHRPLFSLADSDKDKELTNNTLSQIGLSHIAHKALSDISGGERQLTAIARAIVQDTPVMLLDEPTANLDLRHQELIMQILKNEISAKKRTVVMVMHDVNLASRYADYLVLIKDGTTFSEGPASEVLNTELLSDLYQLPLHSLSYDKHSLYIPNN